MKRRFRCLCLHLQDQRSDLQSQDNGTSRIPHEQSGRAESEPPKATTPATDAAAIVFLRITPKVNTDPRRGNRTRSQTPPPYPLSGGLI